MGIGICIRCDGGDDHGGRVGGVLAVFEALGQERQRRIGNDAQGFECFGQWVGVADGAEDGGVDGEEDGFVLFDELLGDVGEFDGAFGAGDSGVASACG